MQKPPVGFKSNGLVFQGGDPQDPNSWLDEAETATAAPASAPPSGFEAEGLVFRGGDPNNVDNWLDTTRTRGFGETLNDYAITAGNAALGFGKAVSDAVAPDNFISQGIQALIDTGLEKRSDIAEAADLRRQRLIEDADSLGGEAAAFLRVAAENPGLTAAEIFGNLGLVGGIVKKSAIMASSRAMAKGATQEAAEAAGTRVGTAVGVGLGGLGAGGDAAGTAFELVQQTPFEVLENDDDFRRLVDNGMKPEAAREELATRAARDAQLLPTIVGAAGGAIGFEKLLAGGKAFGGGAISRTLKSGAVEAVPEAFEEGLTTFEGQRAAAEYNPEIDPMKGVGAAAAAGGLFGGLAGGAAGLASPIRNVDPEQIAQAQSVAEAAELAIASTDLPLVTSDLNAATDAYLGPDLTRIEQDPNSVTVPMDENLPNSLVSVAGDRGIQTSDIEPGAQPNSPAVDRVVQQIQSNIATRGMATESEAKFLEQYAPGTQPAPTAAPSELPGAFTPTPELQGVKRAPAPEPVGEVQQFIAAKRQENTPAAQELVRQFDAGAITPAALTQQMQTQRELANQRATAPTDTQTAQARIEEAAAVGRMEQTKGTGKLVILPSLGRADENGSIELVPAELDAQGNTLAPAKTIKLVDADSLSVRSETAKNDKGMVTSQTLSRDQFNAIQALVRPFGVNVQLYESDTAGDGFIMPSQRNKVFLNTKSSIQASSVVFHEMGHLMEREVPEAYAALKKVLVGQTTEADQKGFAAYYGSKEFMADELVGDSVGQLLSKPETLTQVFEQIEKDYGTSKARGIISRLVAALNKALNTLLKTFQNNDFKTVGQFVGKTEAELQAVKAAVREAAVAYARKQRGEAATVQGRMLRAERDISLTSTKAESVAETPDPIGSNLEEAEELGQPVLTKDRPQLSAARIIFEVAPDPNNTKLKSKWDSFDEIEKSRISQEVLTQVMPEVLKAAGVKAKNVTGQIGGYLDDSNPSFTALFDSPKLQLGKVLEATNLAGFALAQDSMMVVADKPFEGSFETGFITLTLPKSVDPDSIDSVHEVYKKLRALDPDAIQGHTTVGREMGLAVPLEKMEALQKAIEELPDVVFENPSFSTQYMAFPTKEDYDYGDQRKLDQQGSKLAEQQRGTDLRARAEQALNEAFERRDIQPNVARSSVPFRDKDGNFVRRKLGLNPDPKGREINRVRQIAQAFDTYLKQMSGRPVIERDDYSTEARDELAQAVADEVAYQIKQNNSGLGWYSSNYPKAVKKLSRRFPELKSNENARTVFSALVAITSNGEEVSINAAAAVKMYEQYRAGKPLREIVISSRRADAMNATVQRFAELLERMPLGQAKKYLMEEITVAQMNTELRALGEKSDGSYKADTVVPRSAVVLGPKIGAFFANLMGSEGYLTMDLWWTRSINRMRGLLIPEPTDSSIDTLRDFMNLPAGSDIDAVKDAARPYRATYKNNNFKSDLELAMGRKEGRNDVEKEAFAEEARAKFGKDYPEMYRQSRIQKAANTVLKTEDEINEAPANASDREFMYGVAREAQRVLKESDTADLSLADIQAALWYYEKKLYEALSGKKGSDIGYDEAINRLADQGEPVDAVRKFKATDKDNAPKFSAARAVAEVKSYAETLNDSFFRTPTITDTKDVVEIGQRLGLNIRRRDNTDGRPHVRELYVVNFEGGREAYITVARRDVELGLADGDVYVNVGGLESGDQGGRVYMAAGALAFNRQLRLVGDPDGITEAGKRRRLENMIALALKYKTTSFFAPHSDMLGWNGLQWRGSDDQKLQFMLQSSYAVSSKLVPEIKNVTFDENTATFRRIDDGSVVPPSAFVDMASRAREATPATRRDGMPGSGTLRLGVIYKSLASAADPAQPVTAGLSPEQREERTRALRDSTERVRFSTARERDQVEGVTDEQFNEVTTDQPTSGFWGTLEQLRDGTVPGVPRNVVAGLYDRYRPASDGRAVVRDTRAADAPVAAQAEVVGNYNPRDPRGLEAIQWDQDFGGGRGYISFAKKSRTPFGTDQFAVYFIPSQFEDESWTANPDQFAFMTVAAVQLTPGSNSFEVGVGGPEEGTDAAELAQQRGLLTRTGVTQPDGTEYLRVELGALATRMALSESVRRLSLNTRQTPDQITWSRDTGAAPGRSSTINRETIQARFSTQRSPLGFYSKLLEAVPAAPKSLKTGQQWAQWVSGGKLRELGVKQEEIEWSGVKDYLDAMGKEPVSLADVQEYLRNNGVQVNEVTQRDRDVARQQSSDIAQRYGYEFDYFGDEFWFNDQDGDTVDFEDLPDAMQKELEAVEQTAPARYEEYTLPGGENYREVLLTLPEKKPRGVQYQVFGAFAMGTFDTESAANEAISNFMSRLDVLPPADAAVLRKAIEDRPFKVSPVETEASRNSRYKSDHWIPENVLAHIRLNDRTDADGNKVLFVEELQSDWGQDGKKKGFVGNVDIAATEARVREITARLRQLATLGGEETKEQQDEWNRLSSEKQALNESLITSGRIPLAPFVTDTKGWLGLGLKRVVSMAVQGGYDKVAFVTGEQSADRYDLSKQVAKIEAIKKGDRYNLYVFQQEGQGATGDYRDLTADQLADYVGKDLAEKIVADGGGTYSGLQLKVGGEGMKAFYDKIVPQEVRSLIKKFDGQLERVDVVSDPNIELDALNFEPYDGPGDGSRLDLQKTQQPGFTITDKMRDVVAKEGLPLFSNARASDPLAVADRSAKDEVIQFSLRRKDPPKKTVTAYKLFRVDPRKPGQLFPLFVLANEPVPVGTWLDADIGEMAGGKVKSKLGPLAFRPGWHAGDLPLATHIGGKSSVDLKAPDIRPENQVWAEVEMAADVDWQAEATARAERTKDGRIKLNTAHITDQIPEDGYYTYKTNANMTGSWLIGGAMKVTRVLSDAEVARINEAAGTSDLPRQTPFDFARYGFEAPAEEAPADTPQFSTKRGELMDNVIYKLQDKLVDLKRLQQDITKSGKTLQDEINAYQTETLYHGRSAKQSQDFLNLELQPLLGEMRMRKVERTDFEKYLWNRHAEERNIQIAKVNERFPDGGSGIKTADARAYLASLDPAQRRNFEALSARIDRMVERNLQMMVDTGLETQETVNAMKSAYAKYVPLMRGEGADYNGSGSGYSIKGATTKRALGSDKEAKDILSSLASQRDKIITRAEKARVGRSVMGLALENPDENVWFVFDPLLNDPKKNPRQREELRDQLEAMGIDPDLADEISAQPYEEVMGPSGKVIKRPNRKLTQVPNALGVRIAGEDKYVVFNQNNPKAKRMAESLANLDTLRLEGALGLVAKASRYFASINTQYNPVFGIVNLIRDVQGAMINLTSTKIAGKQAQVTKGLLPAMKAIYQVTRARRDGDTVTGEWADLYDRFQNVGAQTGFRDMFESARERTEKQLDRTLDPSVPWQTWQKTGAPVFDWLSDYNETLENAVRLSAFKTALDQGMTDAQAASVAKNLTVNFNRRGQVGTQAGAVYAFFNASVQGSARLVEALNGPKGRQIIGGGLLIGVAQTVLLAMAGYDDEEPPEFIKERNLVIPTGDSKYITVPMPLGLHVIPNLGRIAAEQLMGRTQSSPAESVARLFATTIDAFNPVGSSTFLQTVSPTILDPAVALSENKDFSGKPIYREDFNPGRPTPGYTRARDNSIEYLTSISKALNYVTGGSDFTPGLISPTPDQLEYAIGQLTGGVGRELSKVVQVAETGVTGEELPTYKVPLFGRLYGDRSGQASQGGQFYANLNAMHEHKLEITGRIAEGLPYQDYMAENPEAVLFKLASTTEQRVQELRRRKTKLKEAGAGPETIRQLEEAITATMKRFNETVNTARGRNQTVQG